MVAVVHSEKTFWSPRKRLMAGQSQGRRPGRLPGGHVGDKTDLMKAVMLCDLCAPKFNADKAGYTTKPNIPRAHGRCDGCQEFPRLCVLLVPHKFVCNL